LEVFEVITGFQLLFSILQSRTALLPSPNLKLRIVEHFYISAVGSLISLENSVLELQIFDILFGNRAKWESLTRSGEELYIVFWDEADLKAEIILSVALLISKKEATVCCVIQLICITNLPLKVAFKPSWF
jgi:hypothetical protein